MTNRIPGTDLHSNPNDGKWWQCCDGCKHRHQETAGCTHCDGCLSNPTGTIKANNWEADDGQICMEMVVDLLSE